MTPFFHALKIRPTVIMAVFCALTYLSVDIRNAPAGETSTKITLKSPGTETQGRPIRLVLHIVPSPTPDHPLHLHLYIDGRMVMMTTATKPLLTVSLPPLGVGRHEVGVMEADMVTHREKSDMKESGMEGMGDMGGMEDMDMKGDNMPSMSMSSSPSKKRFMARFTLIVKGKNP